MAEFSPAFWKWFGESRVVDAHGQPLVVYHGSPSQKPFYKFSGKKAGTHTRSSALGFFFTDSWDYAAVFTHPDLQGLAHGQFKKLLGRPSGRGSLFSVYLSIQNPAVFTDLEEYKEALDIYDTRSKKLFRDTILEKHDGVILKNLPEYVPLRGKVYIPFYPEQIKATDNDGTWDADDPDIRSNPRPSGRRIGNAVVRRAPSFETTGEYLVEFDDLPGAELTIFRDVSSDIKPWLWADDPNASIQGGFGKFTFLGFTMEEAVAGLEELLDA